MSIKRRQRIIFAWAIDRSFRDFCIERCKREIEHADRYFKVNAQEWHQSQSYKAAVQLVRKKLWLAQTLPFLSCGFLGLDKCWLKLLGYRFTKDGKGILGGLETAITVAEKTLNLPAGSAQDWSIETLFSVYNDTKLRELWEDVDPPKSPHLKIVS